MTITNWAVARQRHAALDRCARADEPGAKALWLAIQGRGEAPAADSYVEAAADAAPADYAAAIMAGGTATAYAVACLHEHAAVAAHVSPFERRDLARKGWAKFCERAKLAGDVAYGLGFDESESWECARDFAERRGDTEAVMRIARMAGRMLAQLRRQKSSTVCRAPEELHSVELGDNIARLLPSELMHLGQPTEVLLLDALSNHRALQYAMRGKETKSRGPLVLALDESGSMNGTRGEWAKACAVALTRAAWDDKRPVSVVHWSTSVNVTELPVGHSAGLVTMIRHWFGGGNDAARALDCAVTEVARMAKAGDKGADVVLITDGVEDMTESHVKSLDALDAAGVRLWTIACEEPIAPDCILRSRATEYALVGGADVEAGNLGAMSGAVIPGEAR